VVKFTWDPDKSKANVAKHGVTFEEAASAILDPFALEAPDLLDPERLVVIGMSARHRVLFVVTIARDADDTVRIISARRATAQQRKRYEEAP
jgi:uncharacterized DUF497 family protein